MSTQKLSGDVEVAGAITGASLDVTGDVAAASATISGAVESDTLETTGDATVGGDVIATGDLGGTTATITGEVSAGTVSATGDITTDATVNAAAIVASDGAFIPNIVLCGSYLKFYGKTLAAGAASWNVAGDGFVSVSGVIATRAGAGGGAALEWADGTTQWARIPQPPKGGTTHG
jgi:cytoskeletal protein CcmA (bactofilin family)